MNDWLIHLFVAAVVLLYLGRGWLGRGLHEEDRGSCGSCNTCGDCGQEAPAPPEPRATSAIN